MYPTEDSPVCGLDPFHRQIQCKQFCSAGFSSVFCAYRCGLSFLRRRSLGVTDSGTLAQSPLHGSSRRHDGAPLVPAPAGHRGFIPPRRGAHPFSVVLVAMCLDSGPLFPWSPFVRTYGTICRISLTDILKPVKPPTQVYTMIKDFGIIRKALLVRCRFYFPFTLQTGNHNIVASLSL